MMTPFRSHGRGTPEIDRTIAGIGRIRVAVGTNNPDDWRGINTLLTRLRQRRISDPLGPWEAVLVGVRDGAIRPLELLRRVEAEGLDRVAHELVASWASTPAASDTGGEAVTQTMALLHEEWDRWIATVTRTATRQMYALAWRHLTGGIAEGATVHLPSTTVLGDVEAVAPALQALRKALHSHAPTFNRCRASWQAFLKWHVGTRHPAYLAIEGVPPLKEQKGRRRRVGLPLAKAIEIREGLSAPASGHWWDLVTSGMRVGEYFENDADGLASWSATSTAATLRDSKTGGTMRVIPVIGTMAKPVITVWRFRNLLRPFGVTPHAARYTFRTFAREAGIPEERVEQYLGHHVQGMRGLYSTVDLADWVESDRETLLSYVAVVEQRRDTTRRESLRRA